MRAIQYDTFGGPEVLQLVEVPVPEPGPGQVRVAVWVAGVNGVDSKIREGELGDQPMPQRPGLELSGVVDAAGQDAPARVGDEVFGWTVTGDALINLPFGGAYAEYALADIVSPKPATLPWTDAASLPVAGETALRGLRLLDVRPGEVLLVHGGSGVVGAAATQFAIAGGITVIATTGDANADYVASLGASPVRYGEGLVERVRSISPRVDAVLDAAGFGVLPDSITLRGGPERIVTLADPGAFDMGITFSPGEPSDHNIGVLSELADKATAGELRIRHARSYSLTEAAQAQQVNAAGHAGGKITLEVN
jgi:NADPH:quinone reductase-like Zn-dependent oxidoreductase